MGLSARFFGILGTLLLAVVSVPSAQAEGVSPELKAKLKAELKEELKRELLEEMKPQDVVPSADSLSEDAWAEEEWKWSAPKVSALNFVEFDGYFRFRYDFFHNLDLDLYRRIPAGAPGGPQENGPFSKGEVPPVPGCDVDPQCGAVRERGDSQGGANMRLRLEPTLNVFEDVQIKMQLDVLDNIVLGSTPVVNGGDAGISGLAEPANQGTFADSIRVRRAWAEVMTPLGQLKVGRQPHHFGMGLLANDGRGLDTDHGDTTDRIMFVTKLAGFYIAPGFDWGSSGPVSASPYAPYGQAYDRDQRDDIDQYVLAIVRQDDEQAIQEQLDNDEVVLSYGVYGLYREQDYSLGATDGEIASFFDGAAPQYLRRDLNAWTWSVWFQLRYRTFLFEFEHVGVVGGMENNAASGDFTTQRQQVDILQFGGAARMEYKLLDDALTLRLLAVVASGDSSPGWGAKPGAIAGRPGEWDGRQDLDGNLNNFRVDPAFYVDMILWRQLVGTVTDALVIRPGIQYELSPGLGASLDVVYSRALTEESTPSASLAAETTADLGVELDLKVFYISDTGFNLWLEYGLLIPLKGLNRAELVPAVPGLAIETDEAGIAQTLQVMMGVTF